MDSDDAIVTLALCSCGHGIGRHDERGCPGAAATFCTCALTPSIALDAAIERVRHASLASRRKSTVSPVRWIDAVTMISMLAPRLVRAQ
jgi:hypothetical protein